MDSEIASNEALPMDSEIASNESLPKDSEIASNEGPTPWYKSRWFKFAAVVFSGVNVAVILFSTIKSTPITATPTKPIDFYTTGAPTVVDLPHWSSLPVMFVPKPISSGVTPAPAPDAWLYFCACEGCTVCRPDGLGIHIEKFGENCWRSTYNNHSIEAKRASESDVGWDV